MKSCAVWSLPPLLLLACVGCVTAAGPTTYYVSSNTGNDTFPGTSTAQPFMTLARASAVMLSPGDSILLERGGMWLNDVLSLANVPDDVTIGAYGGNGSSTALRPEIQVSRSTAQAVTCVSVNNVGSSVAVRGLHVAGCAIGVHMVAAANTSPSGVTVSDCFFRDIRGPYLDFSPQSPGWAKAVSLDGAGEFINADVSNNVGIRMDTFFETGAVVHGLSLDSNTVSKCGGNCVGMTRGDNLHMTNSVFLRDTPQRFFLYGTTDIINGDTVNSSIMTSDFNSRGEYMAGPDGCAIDFETDPINITVSECGFYHSFGAGVMVFGHSSSAGGLTISKNLFYQAGCVQPRSDQSAVALMCPSGHKPSGQIVDNVVETTCTPFYINPAVPGCQDNMKFSRNAINQGKALTGQPIINVPPGASKGDTGVTKVVASLDSFPNATLRYTLDGSRPDETSPVLPAGGYPLTWPHQAIAINVRAFQDGYSPSITNGVIIERNYYLGLPGGGRPPPLAGVGSSVDSLTVSTTSIETHGWVVDGNAAGQGRGPSSVQMSVDGVVVGSVMATDPRPDLIPAGVARNADHGFHMSVTDASVLARLQTGLHVLTLEATGTPGTSPLPHLLEKGRQCVLSGKIAPCPQQA